MEVIEGKKLINIAPIIESRNRKRMCECYDVACLSKYPSFEFDASNQEVRCRNCNAVVSPFYVLHVLSKYWERIEEYEDYMRRQIAELDRYKPWKKVIKKIESCIGRKGEMIPHCPKCGEAFRLEQISGYSHEDCIENKGWVIKGEE